MRPVLGGNLSQAIADWQERGLIDAATAARLREDVGRTKTFSFERFIMLAGVLCLGFAAISFVAANWNAIPRPVRLVTVLVVLWACWGGGLWAARKARPWIAECLYLLATTVFGAGLALVAQLYHIQGSAQGFVLAWCLGALIAAALARSSLVLTLAIVLAMIWHGYVLEDRWVFGSSGPAPLNLPFLGLWAVSAGLAFWTRSRLAVHALVVAFLFWWLTVLTLQVRGDEAVVLAYLSMLVALVLCLAGMSIPRLYEAARIALHYVVLALLGAAMIAYLDRLDRGDLSVAAVAGVALGIGGVIAALAWWARARGSALAYELWVSLGALILALVAYVIMPEQVLAAAYLLALSIWLTRMGWRIEVSLVRWAGMLGFVVSLMLIYGETVGSLIGTAGFYLGAGVVLLAGGWLSMRLHRAGADQIPEAGQ